MGEIKTYSLSLDEDVVNAAKKKISSQSTGGKLSPVINELLINWVGKDSINKKEKKKQNDLDMDFEDIK
jgi:hypothetical protein